MSPVEKNNFQKTYGAFYTPNKLASELTTQAIEFIISSKIRDWGEISLSLKHIINSRDVDLLKTILCLISNLTILDGSVGEGEFLITSFEILRRISESISKRIRELGKDCQETPNKQFLGNLYGMELDSNTLTVSHELLSKYDFKIERKFVQEWAKTNVINGNFLESNLTSWRAIPKEFPGFDLIIGNPPWGSHLTKEERRHYFEKFELSGSRRNLNSFELFIYQSTNLLKPKDGSLAYYLPKNLTRSNQYVNLRKFLLENYQLKSLIFHELFQNVTQEFITLIAHLTDEEKQTNIISINNKHSIQQRVYLTNTDYIFTITTDPTSYKIISSIKEKTKPLEEYVTIQRGEELSKRGGVMYCNFCTYWVPLSSRKPRIECPQCHKILDKSHLKTKYLINPIISTNHTIPILTGDDFDQYYIKSSHYFDDSIEFKSKKNKELYQSPKIIIQKIKRFPCATVELNNVLTTQNVYNIKLKERWRKKPDYIYYIVSILNSRLMNWYYENQFNLGSKYTNAISIRNLKRLPIRPPEENEKTIGVIKSLFQNYGIKDIPSDSFKEEIDNIVIKLYDCSSFDKNF